MFTSSARAVHDQPPLTAIQIFRILKLSKLSAILQNLQDDFEDYYQVACSEILRFSRISALSTWHNRHLGPNCALAFEAKSND